MFVNELEKYNTQTAVICDDGSQMTYAQFIALADSICEQMDSRELVFVLCKNSVESLLGYIGFLRKKIVPVMLDADIDDTLFAGLLEQYRPGYIWKPRETVKAFREGKLCFGGKEYELWENADGLVSPMHPELALLLTTSGSTGSPKLVRQTYTNIDANARSIATYLALDSSERAITTLPMHYTYGLSIIHSHFLVGATVLMTKNTILTKKFWDFFKAYEATSFGGVPFTYEMLKRAHFTKMDLPSLRTMTQAGGRLSKELQEEYGTYALKTGKNFVVMYGQTEATARMAYLPSEKCLEKLGSIGIAVPNGILELVDSDGNIITEAEEVGELRYRGQNVTLGYANGREDLAKPDEFGGVLTTGDLAKRDADGYLHIVGRKKRFLKIYGSRVNLDEMDGLIQKQFPNTECATTGADDSMVVFVTNEALIDTVKHYILDTTHMNASAVSVIHCDKIPRNSAGKILYKELEERWKK